MNNPTSTRSGGGVETDASSKHQLEKPVDMIEVWIKPLENLWKDQKKKELCQMFCETLSSMDPRVQHSFVLGLVGHSQDHCKRMAFLILTEFETMLSVKKMTDEELTRILTPELKMQALHLAASAHSNVFDILSKLYYLQAGSDNSLLVSSVRVMLAQQQFKEAATCVTKCNLQKCFSLEDICLPLIFQDKANMVKRYVQGFPELQEALVRQLDVFCEQGYDINAYLSEMEISVPGVRVEKLKRRHMTELILRLVKMFKLDMLICPNTAKSEIISVIKNLIHERYSKNPMAQDVWKRLIVSTIGDNKSVQVGFIDQLVWYNDVPAAARWARHYGIDVNQLPEAVFKELQRSDASNAEQDGVEENLDEELPDAPSVDYYPLKLPGERVILVSTAAGIQQCLADITSKPNTVVGIDMEWRPAFNRRQKVKVALCQIATHEKVYLLDMTALGVPETKDIVKSFFQRLFKSEDILKLGFEISGDYKMLGQSFPELQEVLKGEKRTVDLNGLGKQILEAILGTENSSLGLTNLVHFCFGKNLDKRKRISDWEKRPLSQAQMTYAALDAFCLLEIYAHLKKKVSDHDLQMNMEPWISSKTDEKSKSKTKSKTKSKLSKSPQKRHSSAEALNQPLRGPPIPSDQLAVVCDNMHLGLGNHLRKYGVDVINLDKEDEHEKAFEIAKKDGRAIVTSGAPYHMLKSRVEKDRIYCVTGKTVKEQARGVLGFFNAQPMVEPRRKKN